MGPRRSNKTGVERCVWASGFDGRADVPGFEDALAVSTPGDEEHGLADLPGGDYRRGKGTAEKREERTHKRANHAIRGRLRTDSVQRDNYSGAKHVGVEREAQQGILGLAHDPRPHDTPLFRGFGSGAGDVDEDHARVDAAKRLSGFSLAAQPPAVIAAAWNTIVQQFISQRVKPVLG